ncbi:ATP-binding protein [Nocardioides sp.]|uniref:ATP-binding protein n=1 Tax=Nocardioides sp. TaxID=35761 RepID=UPI001A25B54E|nr:ATP-binding protein [Nocardioides sp.]MBJ7359380.1 MASE1 domain-containing protein [Nocardioides sp.]
MLVWGPTYYLASQLGLLTAVADLPLTLVSPSAGVAVVWFATGNRRTWPWDAATLALASLAVSWQLGVMWGLMLTSPLISLTQVAVVVLLLRRGSPDLEPFGRRSQWRLRDLGVLMVASAAGTLCGATLYTVTQALAGLETGDLEAFFLRWARSTAAIAALGSLGLMVVPALRRGDREGGRRARLRAALSASPTRRLEAVALVAASTGSYLLCFYFFEEKPLSFALLVTTAWVGVRFAPVAAALHGAVAGSAALLFTLNGYGPFAGIDDVQQQALIAQLFVLLLAGTGLALAISRAELADSEHVAETRARTLDQVIQEVGDGIALIQEGGEVLMLNQAARELFGTDSPLVHVRPTEGLQLFDSTGARWDPERAPHTRALAGERVTGDEYELREDGRVVRYLRISADRIPGARRGDPARVLVTYHDVTRDRLRHDALATFAGHVAHDLRTPLFVVQSWADVLADGFRRDQPVRPQEGLKMTGRILDAAERMRDFIAALLEDTVTRDRPLERRPVPLDDLARDVAEMRSHAMTTTGSPPSISVTGRATAYADPVLARIVIDNLVANAVKYVAPDVDPVVEVELEETAGVAELRVIDNGIGIPPDERQRVFEPFRRLQRGGIEGAGLGLGICQRIVERHGGSISVLDTPHSGTCVRVRLPRSDSGTAS